MLHYQSWPETIYSSEKTVRGQEVQCLRCRLVEGKWCGKNELESEGEVRRYVCEISLWALMKVSQPLHEHEDRSIETTHRR